MSAGGLLRDMKPQFARSIGRPGAPLHFAAHSHHPWPDVTLIAQKQCWEDAARLLDTKWDYIFGTIRPAAQGHVARALNLSSPESVTFAPNTHELLVRILSCLPHDRPLRVLASDAEFHSFRRQMARLEEEGLAHVERVPAQPFETFTERFTQQATAQGHDLVYLSQVFFNSGYGLTVPELMDIAGRLRSAEAFFVIDGYHSFLAEPVDFRPLETRAFYMSGGYKYAMAGEGCVFLHAPPGYGPRPRNTGWYAAFSALSGPQDGTVGYGRTAARFDGATFDPSGLYRFNAVMDWLVRENLTVEAMSAHTHRLQAQFLERIRTRPSALDGATLLVDPDSGRCGRFLTFETPDAAALYKALMAADVITDYRENRLRIGFGIYQDPDDVNKLVETLTTGLV